MHRKHWQPVRPAARVGGALLLVLALAGCGPWRPAILPGAALVVMLHGGFGTGAQAEKSYHWDTAADRAHFVVAYPDGLDRAWNTGGGCCGVPGRTDADDIGFITAMVSAIEHELPVSPRRVYATGISNGGIMAYILACQTTVFAAIGPDSATELGACPAPAPVSVIAIHGTADQNIPYDGGRGDGVAHIDGPAVPAVSARWRRLDYCAAPVMKTTGVVTTSAAACPSGRAVELITIAGAGHQWPGAAPSWLAQNLLHNRPALHGAERDAGHLAVLRRPPPPGPLRARLSPARRGSPASGQAGLAPGAPVTTYLSRTALPIQSLPIK
jgi:polyhydroxybutyrate depolymerase